MEIDYISFYMKHVDGLGSDGKQYKGWCPFHSDREAKMKDFSVNPSSGLWKCLGSCNTGGDVFTFCKMKRIPEMDAPGYDPVARRYSYQSGVRKRFISGKRIVWEKPQGSNKTPYNVEDIYEAKQSRRRLWICGGEQETEILVSAGELAIGLPSTADFGAIESQDFREIEQVILAFDNDDAGRRAAHGVSAIIPWADVIRWPQDKPSGYGIANCHEEGGDEGFIGYLEILTEALSGEPPLEDHLKKIFERSQGREPDAPLGYKLTRYNLLEKHIDGIQPGLYIVAAGSGMGKTSFCLNLYLDLLMTNPDLAGIYFALDDNRDVIINRLLSIFSEIPMNEIQKKIENPDMRKRLTEAYTRINKYSKEKRLFIYDQSRVAHTDDVERLIRKRLNRKLFVIIDGLLNLDTEDKTEAQIRAANTARANALKRLADIYGIPVICTAELKNASPGQAGRIPGPDDIIGMDKLKHNASLILLICPEDVNAFDEADHPVLEIKYAKNRLSSYRRTDTAIFHRSNCGISDMRAKKGQQ